MTTHATLESGDLNEPNTAPEKTDEPAAATPEAPTRPWPQRLVHGSGRLAFELNERFVGLARKVDSLTTKAERAVTGRLWPAGNLEGEEATLAAREEQLVRWARVRLSELHLRVGQSLYQLEDEERTGEAVDEAVQRQLLALLAEIDRLEGILSRAGNKPNYGPFPNDGEEAEHLFSQLEIEPGNGAEGI